MPSHVIHLESAIEPGHLLAARTVQTMYKDRPLWVRYDLNTVRETFTKMSLQSRPHSMWRYRELLPYEHESNIVTLGETMSPILECPTLGSKLGIENLYVKDESRLPTGSFKSRGMAMAVTMAKSLGMKQIAVPTAGNAGGALAAYCAKAGLECYIFMPSDTPIVNQAEAVLYGAKAYLVDGLINDCGKIVKEGREAFGWFDMSTLKEPYRIEGKKTMGLELAEQFEWDLPDVILYPTGGGTGLIGMWKAFAELIEIGWLPRDITLPRMISCQSSGCSPIVNAYKNDERFATPIENAMTVASGLRVPAAVGDFMILDAVRESGGRACVADETKLYEWMKLACETEGVALCPESAACVSIAEQGIREGWIKPDERVVIFNTGAMQKYVEVIAPKLPTIASWEEVG